MKYKVGDKVISVFEGTKGEKAVIVLTDDQTKISNVYKIQFDTHRMMATGSKNALYHSDNFLKVYNYYYETDFKDKIKDRIK